MTQNLNFGKLPGFGLPVKWIPNVDTYHATLMPDGSGPPEQMPLLTLRELAMLGFMNRVTDKPGWEKEVFDSAITTSWKGEVSQASIPPNASNSEETSIDMTEKMLDWCIAELQSKAKAFEENGGLVSVFDGDVVKSDTAISPDLQAALKAAVKPLEDVPNHLKDWRPGSDNMVLDLINPSLFPLVYGRTKVLNEGLTTLDDCIQRCGEGVVPERSGTGSYTSSFLGRSDSDAAFYSNKFQWLPCEVEISASDPNTVRITSYINNLHPERHSELYSVIEQVIARAIPLWNRSLTPTSSKAYKRIPYRRVEHDLNPENLPGGVGPQREEGEDESDYQYRRREWVEENRRVILPEPRTFKPFPYMKVPDEEDLKTVYGDEGLQIIAKITNIHLTPEKPEYKGGKWHAMEGLMNEHICATAVYYYDSENIANGQLAFRQQSSKEDAENVQYPDDGLETSHWLGDVFGACDCNSTEQELGFVETRAGRLITFPNTLHRKLRPFSLKDRSKPGHLKILTLFLVDPIIRIISTAHVPCQRRDWWENRVNEQSAIGGLPLELRDQIFQKVESEFPFCVEEAKELRLKLIKERKRWNTDMFGKIIRVFDV